MRNICLLGFALLAMVAFSALSVGSASALETLFCMKVLSTENAKFLNKADCEALVNEMTTAGGWEWLTFSTGEEVLIEVTSGKGKLVASGTTIECQADKAGGEATGGLTFAKTTVTFTKCKDQNGHACNSLKPLGGAEEILTSSLDSEIVLLKAGATPVGLLLLPEVGTEFTEISCNGINLGVVSGEIIGEFCEGFTRGGVKVSPPENLELLEIILLFEPNAGKTEQLWTLVEETGLAHRLTAFGGFVNVYEESTEKVELLTLNEAGTAFEMTDFEIMAP